MAPVITLKVRYRITERERAMLAAIQPKALEDFLVRQGPFMVEQARKNIIRAGTRANAGTIWPKLSEPYAKRKAAGKTDGGGTFNYAMLRDTGQLYDSLFGKLNANGGRVTVSLEAEGARNADLLRYHHLGTDKMPARSPVYDMRLFEKRYQQNLDAYLSGRRR